MSPVTVSQECLCGSSCQKGFGSLSVSCVCALMRVVLESSVHRLIKGMSHVNEFIIRTITNLQMQDHYVSSHLSVIQNYGMVWVGDVDGCSDHLSLTLVWPFWNMVCHSYTLIWQNTVSILCWKSVTDLYVWYTIIIPKSLHAAFAWFRW
jgi:hypothetical protein